MAKTISICKNTGCANEFVSKHKRHYYCCDVCKYTHYNKTGTHKEAMLKFNKSEKGKARYRKYLQTENGKKKNAEKSKRQRERNYEKCTARIKASRVFKVPGKCSVDGCDNIGEKHHPDYNRPLDIVYLCKLHHVKLHQELISN